MQEIQQQRPSIVFRRIHGRIIPIRVGPSSEKNRRPDRSDVNTQTARTGVNIARAAGTGATLGGAVYGAGWRVKKGLDSRITSHIKSMNKLKAKVGPKPKFSRPAPLFEWVDDTPLGRRSGATKKAVAAEFKAFNAAQDSHFRRLDVWDNKMRGVSHYMGQIKQLKTYSNLINSKLVKASVGVGAVAAGLSLGYLTYTQIRDYMKKGKGKK